MQVKTEFVSFRHKQLSDVLASTSNRTRQRCLTTVAIDFSFSNWIKFIVTTPIVATHVHQIIFVHMDKTNERSSKYEESYERQVCCRSSHYSAIVSNYLSTIFLQSLIVTHVYRRLLVRNHKLKIQNEFNQINIAKIFVQFSYIACSSREFYSTEKCQLKKPRSIHFVIQ